VVLPFRRRDEESCCPRSFRRRTEVRRLRRSFRWCFLHGGGPRLAMARVIGGRDGVSFGEVRAARRSNTREPDLESLRCILEPQARTVLRSPLSTAGVFVHLEKGNLDEVPKASGPRGDLRAPVTRLPHSRRGTGSTRRVRKNEVPGGSHGRNSLVENFCVRQFVEMFTCSFFLSEISRVRGPQSFWFLGRLALGRRYRMRMYRSFTGASG
jgi:hypothetical protein